jgi:hypothetical protein
MLGTPRARVVGPIAALAPEDGGATAKVAAKRASQESRPLVGRNRDAVEDDNEEEVVGVLDRQPTKGST